MHTKRSKELFTRASKVLVEGVGSASRGPAAFGEPPKFIQSGAGTTLRDVDGNEYIDWMMAFGALPLGHAHPKIVEVVQREISHGSHFATALEIEVELAELLVGIVPNVEKVRFANTGTEAVMACVRLARGLTGRKKILKFEGHYHGWYDAVLVNTLPRAAATLGIRSDPIRLPDSSGLTIGSWEDTLVIPWNDADQLERTIASHGREIACVVTEGVMSNMGVIPPKPGYLQRMQELCRECGALFYLDETVTGFRLGKGGCAELYGLQPDIRSFGKALGCGFPVAAIAGRASVMEGLEWGKVLHFGTHNSGRLALHVAKAMLQEMLAPVYEDRDTARRESSPVTKFDQLQKTGDEITARLREVFEQSGKHPVIVQNVGSLFQVMFTRQSAITDYREFATHVDVIKYREFSTRLREHGIFITPNATLHSVTAVPHTPDQIAKTIDAVRRVLQDMPAE